MGGDDGTSRRLRPGPGAPGGLDPRVDAGREARRGGDGGALHGVWQVLPNLRPGPEGSEPRQLTALDGLLIFTADDGHFGREPYIHEGIKFFEWENAKDLKKYSSMNSDQVSAALKSSNFLTKWVD
mgnify:CR=1 FL=1